MKADPGKSRSAFLSSGLTSSVMVAFSGIRCTVLHTSSSGNLECREWSDSQDVTGRIYDRLVSELGKDKVFKDVDAIPLGTDFRAHLNNVVNECQAVLVVVGTRWLDAQSDSGRRRLDDPDDFVRIELEAALARGIPVIPVLVSGTTMPTETQLPPSLAAFAYRQVIPVRPDPDFHHDMDRLTAALRQVLDPQTPAVVTRARSRSEPARSTSASTTESSAQMIVTLVKRHRVGLADVAALLVFAVLGGGYWLTRRQTTPPSVSLSDAGRAIDDERERRTTSDFPRRQIRPVHSA